MQTEKENAAPESKLALPQWENQIRSRRTNAESDNELWIVKHDFFFFLQGTYDAIVNMSTFLDIRVLELRKPCSTKPAYLNFRSTSPLSFAFAFSFFLSVLSFVFSFCSLVFAFFFFAFAFSFAAVFCTSSPPFVGQFG